MSVTINFKNHFLLFFFCMRNVFILTKTHLCGHLRSQRLFYFAKARVMHSAYVSVNNFNTVVLMHLSLPFAGKIKTCIVYAAFTKRCKSGNVVFDLLRDFVIQLNEKMQVTVNKVDNNLNTVKLISNRFLLQIAIITLYVIVSILS